MKTGIVIRPKTRVSSTLVYIYLNDTGIENEFSPVTGEFFIPEDSENYDRLIESIEGDLRRSGAIFRIEER